MNRIEQRFGAQPDMVGLVSTLVITGILLCVGIVVFAKVKAALPDDLSAAANSTLDEVEATTFDSFELSTVGLIVLAAAVIIAVLLGAFGA